MSSITVKATFTGQHGSCGYRTDSKYTLIIRHKVNENIQIENMDGGGWCEYSSMVSFLENWNNIVKQ